MVVPDIAAAIDTTPIMDIMIIMAIMATILIAMGIMVTHLGSMVTMVTVVTHMDIAMATVMVTVSADVAMGGTVMGDLEGMVMAAMAEVILAGAILVEAMAGVAATAKCCASYLPPKLEMKSGITETRRKE